MVMHSKEGSGKKISRKRKIVLAMAILLAFFAATEGILRVLGIRADPSKHSNRFQFEQDFNLTYALHEPDPDLFWRLKENVCVQAGQEKLRTNSSGLRGGEIPLEKDPGTLRIACMGDSCTFGFGIPKDEETYPSVLERLLLERDPQERSEVINAGVVGYSSFQGLLLLRKKILALSPDIITFYFGFNDHHLSSEGDRERGLRGGAWGARGFMEGFRLFGLVRAVLAPLRDPAEMKDPKRRVPLEEFGNNCRSWVRTVRENKSTAILLTTPVNPEIPLTYNELPVDLEGEEGKRERKWIYQNKWIQDKILSRLSSHEISRIQEKIIQSDEDRKAHFKYIALLEGLLKEFPDWPSIPFYLSQEYFLLGDKDKFSAFLARSLSLDGERRVLKRYNQKVREIARNDHVPLVDLERPFGGEGGIYLFLPGDAIHPNPAGQEKIAQEILKVLAEEGLL